MATKDVNIVSIFLQSNRQLKTASKSTEPFKPRLKTAIVMNEVNTGRSTAASTLRPST
jgi:hypothetical protein